MKLMEHITVEPGTCGGRPCIRGLRIRLKDILEMLADGAKPEEILADFLIWRPMTSKPRCFTLPAGPITSCSRPLENSRG